MQSTVVKHKKDGGQSGGVFDSYIIVRVSSFIHGLQPNSFDLLTLTLLRQRIVIGCSRPPFIKRTREPDANFSTDRERVGWRILCRASYTQSSDVS